MKTSSMNKKNSRQRGRNVDGFKVDGNFSRPNVKSARKKTKKGVLIILVVLLLGSLAAAFYFRVTSDSESTAVFLQIDSPVEVIAGQEVEYKIVYQNQNEVAIKDINLSLEYPNNWHFVAANVKPNNDGNNYWLLPELASQHEAEIIIRGYYSEEKGFTGKMLAVMSYIPANFSSTFSVQAELQQTIDNVAIDMWVDAPTELLPSQNIILKVHILNHQTIDWQPIIVSVVKPEELVVLDADPIPTTVGNLDWQYDIIESEQEKIIIINSEIAPAVDKDSLTVKVRLQRQTDDGLQLLDEDIINMQVVRPQLEVSLSFTNEDKTANYINWGDLINYQLSVKNNGDYVPKNMRIILAINTDFINWQAWQDTPGLYREDNKIIWTVDNQKIGSKLANFAKNEEINIKIGAKLQAEPIDATTLKDQDLRIAAIAKIEFDIGNDKYVGSSDILLTKIGKEADFWAQVKYYDEDGQIVGAGPIPPKVGQETYYVIDWELSAGEQNLKDIKVTTSLPPNVKWQGGDIDNQPQFNQSSRTLVFSATELISNNQLSGSFRLSVTPKNDQLGQLLTLLNPITLSAKTGDDQLVNKQIDLLTSELIYDPNVQGQGRVVE